MLLKQSWPQEGRADSPGIAVLVVIDDEEEVDVGRLIVVVEVEDLEPLVVITEEEDLVVEELVLEERDVIEELQFPH